jgi:excisionase family DNA binding protein
MSLKRLISVRETAAMLGISERSVWRLIVDEHLSKVYIGTQVRVPAEEVRELMKTGTDQETNFREEQYDG